MAHTFTNPIIASRMAGSRYIRSGGLAQGASPVELQTRITLATQVGETGAATTGARAVGDVDELFVLRRGHRLLDLVIWGDLNKDGDAYSALTNTAAARFKYGILKGAVGGSASSAADRAAIALYSKQDAGAHNTAALGAPFELAKLDTQTFTDDGNDYAIGLEWTAISAAIGNGTDFGINALIRFDFPANNGVA